MVQRPATVFVSCNKAGLVEAVEFGSPSFGEPADDAVMFRDIDVFATPVRDVVTRLRAAGIKVEESEGGYSYTAPELLLAFW